jgi:hypothetical protein
MTPSKDAERRVRNALEAQGFVVHDADVLFGRNCQNIDLVAFSSKFAVYVQVKLSSRPAGKDAVVIHGSPWTSAQLYEGAPVFNEHSEALQASIVVVVHMEQGEPAFYVARPTDLEDLARPLAQQFYRKPKRNGEQRKMFRKELRKEVLLSFLNNWTVVSQQIEAPHT